ncbi:MAG: hypothetical protein GVY36_17840 [Verrucomicrobia bacterium]|nr:hypothetical protein [Verrucomicrobiota bacterium]
MSYLLRIPETLGCSAWSPCLSADVALGTLNLPAERRQDRRWQRDFFEMEGLHMPSRRGFISHSNTLNYRATRAVALSPLDITQLKEFFDLAYLEWINQQIKTSPVRSMSNQAMQVRILKGMLKSMGLEDRFLEAYGAYMCLHPLETFLKHKANPSRLSEAK